MKLDNKVYDILKWVALILLPALGTLYFGLSKLWGFPFATEIAGTIELIDIFLGSVLMISNAKYNKELKQDE